MREKLKRNEQHKMLAGVCAGLADYLGIDVSWVRIFFVLAFVFGCFGGLLYLLLWIVVPTNTTISYVASDPKMEEKSDMEVPLRPSHAKEKYKRGNGRVVFGFFLIAIGAIFLLNEFSLVPIWLDLGKLWPLLIIIPGIMLILGSNKKDTHHDGNHHRPKENGSSSNSK